MKVQKSIEIDVREWLLRWKDEYPSILEYSLDFDQVVKLITLFYIHQSQRQIPVRGKHGAIMQHLVEFRDDRYLNGRKTGKTTVVMGGLEFTSPDRETAKNKAIEMLVNEIARLQNDGIPEKVREK